jgi:alginate O-acetyltransferase complex protein AlgI
MIASIIINYVFSLLIDKESNKRKRKTIFIITILINIFLLGYFKYFNFILNNINSLFGTSITYKSIILPIGISFYTFQIMSYIIDFYRGKVEVEKNIIDLALYISFFPQLIAGPIVKYKDINNQIRKRTVTLEGFAYGTKRFIYGLSKKVLIANTLALVADTIFDSNISEVTTFAAWIGSISYTLQIYYDFSGYSDMAIGLGKMFGFTFNENFNLPYLSRSITEFWKRWHISLSTWFKEYIYIPLGGNRKGTKRTYLNLWIVFIVTGIWHGAAWTFIIWGLYHGFFIFIERLGLKKYLDKCHVINHIYALLVVNFGWVLFRIEGLKNGLLFIKKMIIPTSNSTTIRMYKIITTRNILILIIAILFSCVIQVLFNKIKKKKILKIASFCEPMIIVVLWILCISSLVSNTYNPFIYFRF